MICSLLQIVDDIEPVFNAFIGKLLFPSEVDQHKAALVRVECQNTHPFLAAWHAQVAFASLCSHFVVVVVVRHTTTGLRHSSMAGVTCFSSFSPFLG